VTPTRTFALVLVIAAVACGAYAFARSDSTLAANDDGPVLDTALWSPRRVPQPLVDAVGAQRLQATLDEAVGGVEACFVVDEGGAPLATHGGDLALIPASTQKLLTAAAGLAVLGPDTTLDTVAVAAQTPQEGTVERLFMVGGGDPVLMTPDVQAAREQIPELKGTLTTSLVTLADGIVNAGVRRIPGGIGADDTRYEDLRYLPGWKDEYRTGGQVGPLGALTVNGGFSQLRPPQPVDDPALFAAGKLSELLEERGIEIGRGPSREKAPPDAVEIARVSSPPLKDLLTEELSASDNLGSELLVREIGVRVAQQGTTVAGTQAIASELAELGLPTTNAAFADGSGLDRGNRASCPLLAGALSLGERAEFAQLWDSLAIAGERGTLIDQLADSLTGKVRAKTGTLDGVSGIVGIVDVARPLRFAFLANGDLGSESQAIAFRGRIVEIIATFPDAPPADELVPAPGATGPSGTTGP